MERSDRADRMRQAFDRGFAERPSADMAVEENFLGIRLGAERYALHLSEIAGLFADKHVTPVPSGLPALIGIAGFRGSIAPVYDLHLLLGDQRIEKPNWLATAAGMPVALAFEAFDGHLRIPREAIVPGSADRHSKHIREYISMAGLIRPIVHLPSILEMIGKAIPEDRRRGGTRDV